MLNLSLVKRVWVSGHELSVKFGALCETGLWRFSKIRLLGFLVTDEDDVDSER